MFGRGKKSVERVSAPGGPELMIVAEQVIKTYDTGTSKVQALRGIDFAVARDTYLGVCVSHRSGAFGKSQFLGNINGGSNFIYVSIETSF